MTETENVGGVHEPETGFMSLADLAAMNTDEVAVLTSRLPDAGIYTVNGVEVAASQGEPTVDLKTGEELPGLFRVRFAAEVIGAELLDKTKDPERAVGRKLTESYTLWPADFRELLGLLKGRYQTVGLPNTGNFGGVEGHDPGWVDGMVGHRFRIRVRRYVNKRGEEQASYDWLKYTAPSESEEA